MNCTAMRIRRALEEMNAAKELQIADLIKQGKAKHQYCVQ
jgi:hypothetical protein